jgi:hypothetical protein
MRIIIQGPPASPKKSTLARVIASIISYATFQPYPAPMKVIEEWDGKPDSLPDNCIATTTRWPLDTP